MSKELDDSLFEDVPYQAAPEADDSLFEDVPHPDHAPVEEDAIGDATRGVIGGTAGAGTGVLLNKGLEKVGNLVHNNLGDLDATQIKMIDQNRDVYKTVSPLENILEQFRTLGEKNRQGGMDAAASARKSLEKLPNMPIEGYYQTISKPALDPKLSSPIDPSKQAQIFGSKLDEIAPAQAEDAKQMMSIDEQMNQPFQDERLAINQSIKDAQYKNKLGQLNTPAAPDLKKPIVADFAAKQQAQKLQELEAKLAQASGKTNQPVLNTKEDLTFNIDNRADKNNKLNELSEVRGQQPDYERQAIINDHDIKRDNKKLERLDEKAAEAQEKIQTEIQKIEEKKLKFQESLANSKEKSLALENVNSSNAKAKLDVRKDQLIFNKILSDEKSAQMKNLKQKEKMESLLAQKQKLEEKMKKRVETVKTAAAEEFDSIKNTPKKIRDVAPELNNRVLGQDYANSLQDAISDVEHSAEVSPIRLDQKLQEIRDNVPDGKANTVGKFNAEIAKELRSKLRDVSPEYATGMDKAAESFKSEELFDKLGIRHNKELARVTLDDSGRSKINATLLNPDKNVASRAYLEEALQNAMKQGHLPQGSTVDDLLKKADVSALKGEVGRLKEGKALNAFDVNSIAKGEMSRAPGIIGKMGGTKMQEALALYKSSKLGNGIKALGKYGLPLVGGLAGGMAAANAADSGELSPSQAILAGGAETLNPLPLTDAVQGAVEANKAYDDVTDEIKLSQEYWDAPGDINSVKPALAAVAAGAKGYTAPAVESLDKFGTERSNDARARMEQNMNARAPKAEKPHEEFKSFVEQRPEQIQELAQLFSGDEKTASFVAPLEKAAQADDRTRSAVLFGLYQQPAFRQAMQKGKKGM